MPFSRELNGIFLYGKKNTKYVERTALVRFAEADGSAGLTPPPVSRQQTGNQRSLARTQHISAPTRAAIAYSPAAQGTVRSGTVDA